MNFKDLGLSSALLKAVGEKGYEEPSPIQAKGIPPILEGRDVMAAAQTGTGKTAGFSLPLLKILSEGTPSRPYQVRALILTPTRELASQVGESVSTYGKYLSLKSSVVFGGVNIKPQFAKLRAGVDVLVATPGRLLDLYNQKAMKFDALEVLILDEADRMLDMGFIHDIKKILAILPAKRQNLLFSATFSDDIRKFAKGLVHDPVEISVSPRNTTANTVLQKVCPVDKSQKPAALSKLISEGGWNQVLVFTRTKHGANRLTKKLIGDGIEAAAIHGNKSQGARTKALANFKQGKIVALVATDIAARGLDIDQLPQVVNFDLPNVPEDYIHRIGRTGRAGSSGHAISLVSQDEFKLLSDIEWLTKKIIDREFIEGFEPLNSLPESSLEVRPRFPKVPASGGQGSRHGSRGRSQPSRRPSPRSSGRANASGNRRDSSSPSQQDKRPQRS